MSVRAVTLVVAWVLGSLWAGAWAEGTQTPEERLSAAAQAMRTQEWGKAVAALQSLTRDFPEEPQFVWKLAWAHLLGGNDTEAAQAFERAALLAPGTELAELSREVLASVEATKMVVYGQPDQQVFHRPYCLASIETCIRFQGAQEAVDAGYAPCTVCSPDPDACWQKLQARIIARTKRAVRVGDAAAQAAAQHGDAAVLEAGAAADFRKSAATYALLSKYQYHITIESLGPLMNVQATPIDRAYARAKAAQYSQRAAQADAEAYRRGLLAACATRARHRAAESLDEWTQELRAAQVAKEGSCAARQARRCAERKDWPNAVFFSRVALQAAPSHKEWVSLLCEAVLGWCEAVAPRAEEVLQDQQAEAEEGSSVVALASLPIGEEEAQERMAAVILRLGEIEPELMTTWMEVRDVLGALQFALGVPAPDVPEAIAKLLPFEDRFQDLNKKIAAAADALAERTIAAEERASAQSLLAQAQEASAREDWQTAHSLARAAIAKYPLPRAVEIVQMAEDQVLARSVTRADELETKESFAEAASVLNDACEFTGDQSLVPRIEYLKDMAAAKEVIEAEGGRTVEGAIRLMDRAWREGLLRQCAALLLARGGLFPTEALAAARLTIQGQPAGGDQVERLLAIAADALCPNASADDLICALSHTTPTLLYAPDVHRCLFSASLLVLARTRDARAAGIAAGLARLIGEKRWAQIACLYLGDDPFSLLTETATAIDAKDKERCIQLAKKLAAGDPEGIFTWLPAAAAYHAGASMEFDTCWRRAQTSQYAEWLARKMLRKPELDPALDVCLVTAAKACVEAKGLVGSPEKIRVPPETADILTWEPAQAD